MNWNDLEKQGVTYNEADAVLAQDAADKAIELAVSYLAGALTDSDATLLEVARVCVLACARHENPPPEWKRIVGYALALHDARAKIRELSK